MSSDFSSQVMCHSPAASKGCKAGEGIQTRGALVVEEHGGNLRVVIVRPARGSRAGDGELSATTHGSEGLGASLSAGATLSKHVIAPSLGSLESASRKLAARDCDLTSRSR